MSKQAAPRKVGDKEALAVGTMIRGSAQKLNLVAGLIRGRKVEEALNILKFSPKGMAPEDVCKVLASRGRQCREQPQPRRRRARRRRGVGRQVDHHEAFRDPRARPLDPYREAVQPPSRRRSRAGRSVMGQKSLIPSACGCRSTVPGTAAGSRKARITAACCSRISRSASSSSRRCRRRRSRRW